MQRIIYAVLLLAAGLVIGLFVKGNLGAGSWLPLLLVLACPLMMLTMMGGHGGHSGGEHDHQQPDPKKRDGHE